MLKKEWSFLIDRLVSGNGFLGVSVKLTHFGTAPGKEWADFFGHIPGKHDRNRYRYDKDQHQRRIDAYHHDK